MRNEVLVSILVATAIFASLMLVALLGELGGHEPQLCVRAWELTEESNRVDFLFEFPDCFVYLEEV